MPSIAMPKPPTPTPDSTPATESLDIVFIDGFTGETIIGIHQDELHATQPVRVDLAIGIPRPRACDTDRIGDTVDYGEVRLALRSLLKTHRFQLLEAFAEAVASLLLVDFGAHWVRVGVTKPAKFEDVDGVGVIIERRRAAGDPSGTRGSSQAAEVLSLIATGMVPGGSR